MAAEMNEDRRQMDDLEEGECSESDDADIISDKISPTFSTERPGIGPNAYAHSRIPQIVIHSDESGDNKSGSDYDDEDDDDNCPSAGKKHRRNSHCHPFSTSNDYHTPFVNPLLSLPHKSSHGSAESTGTRGKKRNNVWGSVLTEQILSQDIKQFGVQKSNIPDGYRGVESYDFTIAKDDDRPTIESDPEATTKDEDVFDEIVDLEKEVTRHENRKRKRNVKERIGRRTFNKNKSRSLVVPEDGGVQEVVQAITDALGEANIELFTRIVEAIGKDLAFRLYYMTEDVENAGGMLVNDGCRRRTPGGVFIQLMKSEPGIPSDVLSTVFGPDEEIWRQKRKEERKIRKAARKRQARAREAARKAGMDLDRPQTPTPTEELDLDALDPLENIQDNDGEIVDFPERPATPEPKDDSSDGDEEEDNEHEDISVVIAKAKAAILRSQQELEENGSSDQKPGEGLDLESQNMDMNSLTEASDSHVSSVMSLTEDIDSNEMCDT